LNLLRLGRTHDRLRSRAFSPPSATASPARAPFCFTSTSNRGALSHRFLLIAFSPSFRLNIGLRFFGALRFFFQPVGRGPLGLLLGFKVGRLQRRGLARGRFLGFLAPLQTISHPFPHVGLVTY
jgi:hypothetical protein